MMIQPSRVDQASKIHIQQVNKIAQTSSTERTDRRDEVTISRFSAMVERGRACALGLPDVRADRIAQAQLNIRDGVEPDGADVASSMINSVVEGQV